MTTCPTEFPDIKLTANRSTHEILQISLAVERAHIQNECLQCVCLHARETEHHTWRTTSNWPYHHHGRSTSQYHHVANSCNLSLSPSTTNISTRNHAAKRARKYALNVPVSLCEDKSFRRTTQTLCLGASQDNHMYRTCCGCALRPCGRVAHSIRAPLWVREFSLARLSHTPTITKIDRENTRGELSSLTPRPEYGIGTFFALCAWIFVCVCVCRASTQWVLGAPRHDRCEAKGLLKPLASRSWLARELLQRTTSTQTHVGEVCT